MWPEILSVKQENKRELILNGDKFTEQLTKNEGKLDKTLFQLKQLNFLQLSHSELCAIPEEINHLENLQSLLLFGNHLATLPKSIENLNKLKILDVSNNRLSEFVFDFSKLDHLSSINLCGNEINTFQIKTPTSLHILDLSKNKLSRFPEIPSSVTDLKISKNQLQEIPDEMHLPNLKNLDLSENQITAIPKSLGGIKLKTLNLKQNPLKDKKLFKFIDQNQALKAIMDHITKLGVAPKASAEPDSTEASSKAPEPVKMSKANQVIIKKFDENLKFIYDSSVKDVRTHIVCCIIDNVKLTPSAFKAFLQFQTKLHEGICKKRELATIATHDLALIPSKSLRYAAKNKNDIQIQPLGRPNVITATEYYNKLKAEAEAIRKEKKRSQFTGVYKYLHLLDDQENFAFFETDTGITLSLPPMTNSDVTKLSTNTKKILVEVTSSVSASICQQVMSQLLSKALELNLTASSSDADEKLTLELEQVRFVGLDGNLKSVYPSKVDLEELENDTTQVIRP